MNQASTTAPTTEMLVEQITKNVLSAMQELPGQSYLGGKVIKHRIAAPTDEEALRKQFRSMIAKKFFIKWNC